MSSHFFIALYHTLCPNLDGFCMCDCTTRLRFVQFNVLWIAGLGGKLGERSCGGNYIVRNFDICMILVKDFQKVMRFYDFKPQKHGYAF